MRPRRAVPFAEFEVRIEKLVYGGAGLARHEGKVVFVPFTVPGDLARVRVSEQKRNFARASVVEILEAGPGRQQPACPHFGRCGGCQWQHLEYSRQLEIKRQLLEEILHHHLPQTKALEIRMTGSPEPFGYRSRARIQMRRAGEKARTGFFRYQSHQVEDIESCPLFHPALNQALASVRALRGPGARGTAVLEADLACSPEAGTWAVSLEAKEQEPGSGEPGGPENQKSEKGLLRRQIGEFIFAVTPPVFFQANFFLVGEMMRKIGALARGAGDSAALDLYAGAGLFTLPLARHFRTVVAVESSAEASELCGRNAAGAGLDNVRCVCADVAGWMNEAASAGPPSFDLVVLDPPRAGAGREVMQQLIEWTPAMILYVSCDPHTLARDLACLAPEHYQIDFVEGLDLFPHTYHFESLVRLRRHS